MPIIRVTYIDGLLEQDGKEQVIANVTDGLVSVIGEGLRGTVSVVLEEIASGAWGAGGTPVTLQDAQQLQASAPAPEQAP
jgi:4-oxalocrotonate tautomerase